MSSSKKSIPPQVPGDLLGHLTIVLKEIKGSIISRSRSHSISGKVHLWGGDLEDLDKSNAIQYELRGSWKVIQKYFIDAGTIPLYILSRSRDRTSEHETTLGHVNLIIPFDSLRQELTSHARKSSMIQDIPLISAFQNSSPYSYTVQVEISLTLAQPHVHSFMMTPSYEYLQKAKLTYLQSPLMKLDTESLCTEDDSILMDAIGYRTTSIEREKKYDGCKAIYTNFIESKDIYDRQYPIENLDVFWNTNQTNTAKRITPGMKNEINLIERNDEQSRSSMAKHMKRNDEHERKTNQGDKVKQTDDKGQKKLSHEQYNLDSLLLEDECKPISFKTIATEAKTIQNWWRSCTIRKRRVFKHRSANIIQSIWKTRIKRKWKQDVSNTVKRDAINSSSGTSELYKDDCGTRDFFMRFDCVSGIRELLLIQDTPSINMFDPGLIISCSYPHKDLCHLSSPIFKIDSFDRSLFHLNLQIDGRCILCHPEDWCVCYLWLIPMVQRKMMSKYPSGNNSMQDIPTTAIKICSFKFPMLSLSDPDESTRRYKCPLLIKSPLWGEEISIGSIHVTIGYLCHSDEITEEEINLTTIANGDFNDDDLKRETFQFISSECQTEDSSPCEGVQTSFEPNDMNPKVDLKENVVIIRPSYVCEQNEELHSLTSNPPREDIPHSEYDNEKWSVLNLSNIMESLDELNESLIGYSCNKIQNSDMNAFSDSPHEILEVPVTNHRITIEKMTSIPSSKFVNSEVVIHKAEAKGFQHEHNLIFKDSKSVNFKDKKELQSITLSESRPCLAKSISKTDTSSTSSGCLSDDLSDDSLCQSYTSTGRIDNYEIDSTSSESADQDHSARNTKYTLELSSDTSDSSFSF